jgi:hypothetical protein
MVWKLGRAFSRKKIYCGLGYARDPRCVPLSTLVSEYHPIVDFKLDPLFQIKLQEELDALMLSISDFLHADAGIVFLF